MRFVPAFVGTLFVLCIPVSAQKTITYDELEKNISEQLARDQKFREQIVLEQTLITDYKNKILESRKRIETYKQQKLAILGVTSEHARDIFEKINRCHDDLSLLSNMPDQELIMNYSLLNEAQLKIDSIKTDPSVKLPEIKRKIKNTLELLHKCQTRYAKLVKSENLSHDSVQTQPVNMQNIETYTVSSSLEKSETLFSIAEKVYGDPYKWPIIYSANKDAIDKNFRRLKHNRETSAIVAPSDLILSGQVLFIPR